MHELNGYKREDDRLLPQLSTNTEGYTGRTGGGGCIFLVLAKDAGRRVDG